MSVIGSFLGNVPGLGTLAETYEAAPLWSRDERILYAPALFSTSLADLGDSPTYEIRPGLLLGQRLSDGTLSYYNPTASDGTQIAYGVNVTQLRMQDILTGVNTQKFWRVAVGGPIQSKWLINLDNQARSQMSNRFVFDDNIIGNSDFPWLQFQTKTGNYQILASDNFSHFDNLGAGGAVTFTLPPIANGYNFGFHAAVLAQNFTVASSEGGNMVAYNSITANSVALSTGGQIAGGGFRIYSNAAGTKWFVENISSGAQTIS